MNHVSVSLLKLEKTFNKAQTHYLTYIYAYEAPLANNKIEPQRCQAKPLISWRSGTKYVAMVTKLVFSYCGILLQRIKYFWYKLTEVSFFRFDQNLVEFMLSLR